MRWGQELPRRRALPRRCWRCGIVQSAPLSGCFGNAIIVRVGDNKIVVFVSLLRRSPAPTRRFRLALNELRQLRNVRYAVVNVLPLELWRVCGRACVAASPTDEDLAIVL